MKHVFWTFWIQKTRMQVSGWVVGRGATWGVGKGVKSGQIQVLMVVVKKNKGIQKYQVNSQKYIQCDDLYQKIVFIWGLNQKNDKKQYYYHICHTWGIGTQLLQHIAPKRLMLPKWAWSHLKELFKSFLNLMQFIQIGLKLKTQCFFNV